MEPVCKHLDFWNSTKEQYTNTWTFGAQLIKINGIAEPLLKKKIKTLGPLEPTKNNEWNCGPNN